MIDKINRKILSIIQKNARVSNSDIAKELNMAPSATLERIRKLEKKGIIKGYEARLDPQALDLGLLAFVFIKTDETLGDMKAGDFFAQIPEVLEVHQITGEDCYLIKLRASDTEKLGEMLMNKFGSYHSSISTRTTIVLNTVKESSLLPVEV